MLLKDLFWLPRFSPLSAGLLRTWCASCHVDKCVHWCAPSPGEVLQPELLTEFIAEQAGLLGAEMSVGIR